MSAPNGAKADSPSSSSQQDEKQLNGEHDPQKQQAEQLEDALNGVQSGNYNSKKEKFTEEDQDKVELTMDECYDQLGYAYPELKKWWILTVIFMVQVSMNFNTSLYSNGIGGISEEFHVSEQAARVGAAVFLLTYAFGCELWAPWSEEVGRWPILQLSLLLVNIWQLPVALPPNFATIIVGRALGGLSTAGGSVTLGMIADMWDADTQQYAVAYVVFSSVGGSVLGPVVGGFVQQHLAWRWTIWIQLIFGGFVQILHFFAVPETRTSIMMDKIAKKMRKSGERPNVYGPGEMTPWKERLNAREIMTTWIRPFHMFLTEPIVLVLSLLSGFSDGLVFMFIQSLALVYTQPEWDFNESEIGLAFLPLLVGYFIAWALFVPAIRHNIKERKEKPEDEVAQYESRLRWLLYTAPCLPIGLMGFAWTSLAQNGIHWFGSMVFQCFIGIANYSIYMATIDYMITAYGPYSASATGGNGWSRDFLAGVLTLPATPFYTNIDHSLHLEWPSFILSCIAFVLVGAVYVIYWKGPVLRKRSPFAQQLQDARMASADPKRRLSSLPGLSSRRGSLAAQSRRASKAQVPPTHV